MWNWNYDRYGSIGLRSESTGIDTFDVCESSVHMECENIVGASVPGVELFGFGDFEYHYLFSNMIIAIEVGKAVRGRSWRVIRGCLGGAHCGARV
jgi:hypothetical protein